MIIFNAACINICTGTLCPSVFVILLLVLLFYSVIFAAQQPARVNMMQCAFQAWCTKVHSVFMRSNNNNNTNENHREKNVFCYYFMLLLLLYFSFRFSSCERVYFFYSSILTWLLLFAFILRMLFANLWRVIAHLYANACGKIFHWTKCLLP